MGIQLTLSMESSSKWSHSVLGRGQAWMPVKAPDAQRGDDAFGLAVHCAGVRGNDSGDSPDSL